MRWLLRYILISIGIVSCSEKSVPKHFSFNLNDSVQSYLNSTELNGNDSLKKLYLNATNQHDAVLYLINWGMSLPNDKSRIVIQCATKNAKSFQFTEGQMWALLQQGNLCYEEFKDDSALFYYHAALDKSLQQKNKKIEGWANAHLGALKRMIASEVEAERHLQLAIKIGESTKDIQLLALAYFHLAEVYRIGSKLKESFKAYDKCLVNANLAKDNPRLSSAYFNLGQIYFLQVQYDQALAYFRKAEQLCAKTKNISQESMCMLMMAQIYEVQEDPEKLAGCLERCIPLARQSNNKNALAYSLYYRGRGYKQTKEFDKALPMLKEALALAQEIKNGSLQTFCLNAFGLIEAEKRNDKALEYFNESIKIAETLKDPQRLADTKRYIARLYYDQGALQKSLQPATEALHLALTKGYVEIAADLSLQMSKTYTALNNPSKALEMAHIYIEKKDSLVNAEQIKKFAAVEYNAREEKLMAKQQEKEKTLQAEKKAKDQEIKNQRLLKNTFIGGFGLVCILAFVVFRSLKQNKKAKREIEHQKLIVEEKHREITDSINYAERLQRSLMASTQLLDQYLKNYFVYFNPKEKVSGDFYWCNPLSDGRFLLACADSTGHGVPGAMMSMMNMNSLKECIKEGLTEPAAILDRTRSIITTTLKNDGSSEGGKDGMDCALLLFDLNTQKISFALANNPLWIIRNGQLIEYKADKMPVGKHEKDYLPFTQQEIDLKKEDLIILLTDGFADQFGGDKGKKFKYSNLQQLILDSSGLPLDKMKHQLEQSFEKWRGELEQVDDVCIVGVKI